MNSKYNLWLHSFDKSEQELFRLECKNEWSLFSVKSPYWEKHFRYYHVNYHLWNTESGEWLVFADYKEAYDMFNRRTRNERNTCANRR